MAVTGIEKKVIAQVCIIVEDVEKSAEQYRKIFGWQIPSEYQITRLHEHTKALYYGEPCDSRAKISGFDLGGIQFELLEPLDSPSAWHDYLAAHGEGVHHIAFFVPKTDPAAQSFIEHGYQITQEGLFTEQTGKYTYLDTDKDLAIVIELLEHFGGSPTLNSAAFPEDIGIGTNLVTQVGIIVNDIEAASQRLADVLGMDKPPTLQTAGYEVANTTYKGEASDATAKLAFFNTGQVQIELIEPDEHPSVWRDYLEAKGEGAQHIAFQVKDTQRAIDYLAQFGITVAQQGLYSDGTGIYTYMDSDALLGTTIELLENF